MTVKLCLDSGGQEIHRDNLAGVQTPPSTKTWYPIPHTLFLKHVEEHLIRGGMEVVHESHGLSPDGMRYFGMLQIKQSISIKQRLMIDTYLGCPPPPPEDDCGLVIGLRNDHSKSFAAGLALGSQVFVCDNLSFFGEIVVARKHTLHILRDLEKLTAAAVSKLVAKQHDLTAKYNNYKQTELSDHHAHDLLIRALDAKAIPVTRIPRALEQWRTPDHPEFAEKNVWRLFNAVTESYKGLQPTTILQRSPALQGVMDQACGIVA